MANWSFLTSHARVLMCIAHDPGARLRDIAASLGITERSAHGIVAELAEAGYVPGGGPARPGYLAAAREARDRSPVPGAGMLHPPQPGDRSAMCPRPRWSPRPR